MITKSELDGFTTFAIEGGNCFSSLICNYVSRIFEDSVEASVLECPKILEEGCLPQDGGASSLTDSLRLSRISSSTSRKKNGKAEQEGKYTKP